MKACFLLALISLFGLALTVDSVTTGSSNVNENVNKESQASTSTNEEVSDISGEIHHDFSNNLRKDVESIDSNDKKDVQKVLEMIVWLEAGSEQQPWDSYLVSSLCFTRGFLEFVKEKARNDDIQEKEVKDNFQKYFDQYVSEPCGRVLEHLSIDGIKEKNTNALRKQYDEFAVQWIKIGQFCQAVLDEHDGYVSDINHYLKYIRIDNADEGTSDNSGEIDRDFSNNLRKDVESIDSNDKKDVQKVLEMIVWLGAGSEQQPWDSYIIPGEDFIRGFLEFVKEKARNDDIQEKEVKDNFQKYFDQYVSEPCGRVLEHLSIDGIKEKNTNALRKQYDEFAVQWIKIGQFCQAVLDEHDGYVSDINYYLKWLSNSGNDLTVG